MTPRVGKITIRNVKCENTTIASSFFYGLPEEPIAEITMEDVTIHLEKTFVKEIPVMMDEIEPVAHMGIFAKNIRNLTLKHVEVYGYEGERLITENIGLFEEISNH